MLCHGRQYKVPVISVISVIPVMIHTRVIIIINKRRRLFGCKIVNFAYVTLHVLPL